MHHHDQLNTSIENEIIYQLIECESKLHDKRNQIENQFINESSDIDSVSEHKNYHSYEFSPKHLHTEEKTMSDKKFKYTDCLQKYVSII